MVLSTLHAISPCPFQTRQSMFNQAIDEEMGGRDQQIDLQILSSQITLQLRSASSKF